VLFAPSPPTRLHTSRDGPPVFSHTQHVVSFARHHCLAGTPNDGSRERGDAAVRSSQALPRYPNVWCVIEIIAAGLCPIRPTTEPTKVPQQIEQSVLGISTVRIERMYTIFVF
jgi:hypothetical protein